MAVDAITGGLIQKWNEEHPDKVGNGIQTTSKDKPEAEAAKAAEAAEAAELHSPLQSGLCQRSTDTVLL